jgi:hypothetical protein
VSDLRAQAIRSHNLRFTQQRALGSKVSDEFTVPLCRGHHRDAHRFGDEAAWWKNAGIDPTVTARALWLTMHPLPTRADKTDSITATSLASAETERIRKPDQPLSKRDSNE